MLKLNNRAQWKNAIRFMFFLVTVSKFSTHYAATFPGVGRKQTVPGGLAGAHQKGSVVYSVIHLKPLWLLTMITDIPYIVTELSVEGSTVSWWQTTGFSWRVAVATEGYKVTTTTRTVSSQSWWRISSHTMWFRYLRISLSGDDDIVLVVLLVLHELLPSALAWGNYSGLYSRDMRTYVVN